MKKQAYFPGLHALRFIAATLVIIHHVEQYKSWQGRPSLWGDLAVDHLGHMPVGFFFVLSGFLITYFLLVEREKNQSINLKLFYWKRVIRLWPVYFLVVILSIGLIPIITNGFAENHFDFGVSVVLALIFFLPNVLRIIHPNLVGGNQLWSVGIEEQFYLFWPLLIGAFHKYILQFLFGFIVLKMIGQEFLGMLSVHLEGLRSIYFLLKLFPVEQMAIGGVGAVLVLRKSEYLEGITSNAAFISAMALLCWLFVYEASWVFRSHTEGFIFLILILNVLHRPLIYRLLEVDFFKRMGDASYGIYMYHTMVIALVMSVLNQFTLPSLVYNVILYGGSLLFTFFIARCSFIYFERPFLRLKNLSFKFNAKEA